MVMPPPHASLSPEDAVIAFNPSQRSWVTSRNAGGTGLEKLPPLKGTLLVSEQALKEAADDFGHVVSQLPSAVLRPGSVEDVARMVRFARQHRLKIGARGQGHTTYGHSQVGAGIVIDMSSLATIHSLREDRAVVDGGVQWGTLANQAIAQGLTPPVLPDYLGLSVGGTLAVGGVSNSSFQHGVQVDNVLELEVVTGAGEQVTCSPTQHRELFDAVLAGLGQCGIVVRATLRLIPAPTHVRFYDLGYADLRTQLQDVRRGTEPGRFDGLGGVVLPSPTGGWLHRLVGVVYFSAPAQPDDARVLDGLSYQRGSEQMADMPYVAWVNRFVAPSEEARNLGYFALPHPWCDLFVPDAKLEAFATEVLSEVSPAEYSPISPVFIVPFKRERLTRPLFRVPQEDTFFLFDLLRTGLPGTRPAAEMVTQNRRFFERNREWGGTHYTISAIPLSPEDWKRHFGPAWEAFAAAKRRHDPDNVLTPGPNIFP
jgi:FAD/FMN-containing dehydrogenase